MNDQWMIISDIMENTITGIKNDEEEGDDQRGTTGRRNAHETTAKPRIPQHAMTSSEQQPLGASKQEDLKDKREPYTF